MVVNEASLNLHTSKTCSSKLVLFENASFILRLQIPYMAASATFHITWPLLWKCNSPLELCTCYLTNRYKTSNNRSIFDHTFSSKGSVKKYDSQFFCLVAKLTAYMSKVNRTPLIFLSSFINTFPAIVTAKSLLFLRSDSIPRK